MELGKLIDMMIDEKMSCKEYEEISEEMEDEEVSGMFKKMKEDEHDHYLMLKAYLTKYYDKED